MTACFEQDSTKLETLYLEKINSDPVSFIQVTCDVGNF